MEGNEKQIRLGFPDDVVAKVLKKAAQVVEKHIPEQVLQQREYGEGKKMEQLLSIIRDPKAWGLFFAFVKVVLSSLGVNVAPEQWDMWEDILNAICGIAVGLGIFRYNPVHKAEADVIG